MPDAVVQLNHFRKPASQIESRWAFSAMRPRPSEEIQSSAAYALGPPLSQMKSLVTTLLRTDVDSDDEARKEFITRIDQEIDRIASIVESRLTVTTEATPQMLADSGSQAAVENRMGLVELSKMLEAALVVGASGGNTIRNLLNGSNHDQVWQSIKVSLADQIERSQDPAARLASETVAPEDQEELSDRELDVLRLIGLGRSNKQIANELAITSNTVKAHVSSILGKLGVESRTQAALQMPGILAGSRMRPPWSEVRQSAAPRCDHMCDAEFTEQSPGHFVELVDAEPPNKRLRSGVVNVKEGGRLSVFRRLPFF